jgi:mannose-6-phosphate isomerase-like protein (cupin superfamily)
MSTMTVDHSYFDTQADVMQDIAKTGFWPTTYVSDTSPELPVHYHNYDIIGYVMSGTTYVLSEDNEKITINAGDRLNIPKGAWHAEGEVSEKVTYIVTISEPVGFMEALMPLEPRGPWPEGLTL